MKDQIAASFEYHIHLGLDCYMVKDCGYKIVADSTGMIRYWKDTGQMELVSEREFTGADWEELNGILERSGFAEMEPVLPDENSARGGRTLSLRFSETDSREHVVTAHMDDNSHSFPEGFMAFQAEIESFLKEKAGIQSGMFLDTNPRKF